MASKKTRFKKANLQLSQQIVAMELAFPEFKVEWKKNTVNWYGEIQPTTLSNIYTIQITYSLGMSQPDVIVLNPKIVTREKEQIPHIYPGKKLCLFRPKKKEWSKDMLISETIVPWTSLWLYYYELWHLTGEWLGGGEHLVRKRRKKYV